MPHLIPPAAPAAPGTLAEDSAENLDEDETLDEPDEEPAGEAGDNPGPGTPGACSTALDNPALALLIARVMRQDEAALAELYEQFSARVYAVALRMTHNVGSAEEVLQDTFWQVWRQAPRFDAARGNATTWVLTMARSRAIDACRTWARDPVRSQAQSIDEGAEVGDETAADPFDLLGAVQRDTALHAQLAKLDPLRRQLISLAFFRGMTQDEIADHTGLPLGTVKSHFRRTLAALQAALGPDIGLAASGGVR